MRKSSNYMESEKFLMVKYLKAGHTVKATAEEFGVSEDTVKRRIRSIGYTASELQASIKKPSHNS